MGDRSLWKEGEADALADSVADGPMTDADTAIAQLESACATLRDSLEAERAVATSFGAALGALLASTSGDISVIERIRQVAESEVRKRHVREVMESPDFVPAPSPSPTPPKYSAGPGEEPCCDCACAYRGAVPPNGSEDQHAGECNWLVWRQGGTE